MSDEPKREETTDGRLDEDGLPLDREPTLDDVRGDGSGRVIAVGCVLVVAAAVLVFWVIRGGLLG